MLRAVWPFTAHLVLRAQGPLCNAAIKINAAITSFNSPISVGHLYAAKLYFSMRAHTTMALWAGGPVLIMKSYLLGPIMMR